MSLQHAKMSVTSTIITTTKKPKAVKATMESANNVTTTKYTTTKKPTAVKVIKKSANDAYCQDGLIKWAYRREGCNPSNLEGLQSCARGNSDKWKRILYMTQLLFPTKVELKVYGKLSNPLFDNGTFVDYADDKTAVGAIATGKIDAYVEARMVLTEERFLNGFRFATPASFSQICFYAKRQSGENLWSNMDYFMRPFYSINLLPLLVFALIVSAVYFALTCVFKNIEQLRKYTKTQTFCTLFGETVFGLALTFYTSQLFVGFATQSNAPLFESVDELLTLLEMGKLKLVDVKTATFKDDMLLNSKDENYRKLGAYFSEESPYVELKIDSKDICLALKNRKEVVVMGTAAQLEQWLRQCDPPVSPDDIMEVLCPDNQPVAMSTFAFATHSVHLLEAYNRVMPFLVQYDYRIKATRRSIEKSRSSVGTRTEEEMKSITLENIDGLRMLCVTGYCLGLIIFVIQHLLKLCNSCQRGRMQTIKIVNSNRQCDSSKGTEKLLYVTGHVVY